MATERAVPPLAGALVPSGTAHPLSAPLETLSCELEELETDPYYGRSWFGAGNFLQERKVMWTGVPKTTPVRRRADTEHVDDGSLLLKPHI